MRGGNLVTPVTDGDHTEGAVLSFIDISEIKQLQHRLDQQANQDALTHLPNRNFLLSFLSQIISSSNRYDKLVGVVFIDLDDFKNINDTLGHPIGDQVLQQLANRLTEIVRLDDIVARMGGDEFVVILCFIETPLDASIIAQKLLAGIAEPIHLHDTQLNVNASLGIAIYPNDGDDVESLLKAADTALHKAKQHNRGSYQYFEPAFALETEEMHRIAQQLKKAVTNQHLKVAYQPIVNSQSGLLEAVEALLRFQPLDEYQNIPIFKAIQVAERNGLIFQISDWLLDTAIADVSKLGNQLGIPIKLHINLSAREFLSSNLGDRLVKKLRTLKFPAQDLVVEITESSLLVSPEQAEKVAHQLVSLGILVALDDFGTGYSSLSYLNRLPVSVMKIDQSFVRDVETGTKQASVLSSIIGFGNNLGMKTLCEGIEDPEQHQLINFFGCQQAQGFLYSRATAIANILPQYPVPTQGA